MNETMSIFDFLPEEETAQFKPIKSDDWRWTFADYPEKNGLKVFSCFACGGGSTMGYKLTGCDVLGCCEIDPKMNEIYVKNHNPKHNFLREEGWGKKKKFREGQAEQTLDDLSFVFIETVNKLKPKVMIMENVEGLLLGEAWAYVQRIYKELHNIGYSVKHWLCKGEYMGIPQTRHRVFFIAIRNDIDFNIDKIDLSFNYEPIPFGEIKEGTGEPLNPETVVYKWLCKANENDKRISDTLLRLGEKEKLFNERICWEHNVVQTVASHGGMYRGTEKTRVSCEDIINAQTFPQDYDFINRTRANVQYICGMSVPPVMIKRIVTRLIESGVFKTTGVIQ